MTSRSLQGALVGVAALVLSLTTAPAVADTADQTRGTLPGGGQYVLHEPAAWNGTLLTWSPGYGGGGGRPSAGPSPAVVDWLVDRGYALAGVAAGSGWAVEDLLAAQPELIELATAQLGEPAHVVAWGASMGGQVSVALMETVPGLVDAAVPLCGSIAGAIPMLNGNLDGTYALKTLLAPDDARLQLVDVTDEGARQAAFREVVDAAQQTPEGRARIALAATLAQMPTWSQSGTERPDRRDIDAQQEQLYKIFMWGVVSPRQPLEQRAGGNFSWNTGVDYAAALKASGGAKLVRALYREADLSLDDDLATLDAGERIAADRGAVAYMQRNATPTGELAGPVLTLHETGDSAPVVAQAGTYADRVRGNGDAALLRQVFVDRPGHCAYSDAEVAAVITAMQDRLEAGHWRDYADPRALNERADEIARSAGLDRGGEFTSYRTGSLLRPERAPEVYASGEERVVSGTLEDTTPYRFVVPEAWNGTVFVDLDFAGSRRIGADVQALLDDGAAYGGTTRNVTGWDIASAIDNQIEALDRFEDEAGDAERKIAIGASMGGFVAAGVAQRHPFAIDGVVSMCGGLSGTVSQWNQKLDTVFVLSQLLDPAGTLPVTDVPADINGAVAAWQGRLADAQVTPEGRARIALAAAIGQLPAYSQSAPRPQPHGGVAVQEGWYGALTGDGLPYIGQAMSSRYRLQEFVGGSPSWNTGIDYAAQFAGLDKTAQRVVEDLYRDAGLSLSDDLATVNAGERIAADPDAVAKFARGTEFDGRIAVPVLTMSNIGDQISTVAQMSEYENEVTRAGNADLLRQTYVDSAGHCNFTTAERLTAVEVLLHRLDTGKWSNTGHAQLNKHARGLEMGDSRFLRFTPDEFNRPYSLDEPAETRVWTGQLANGTDYDIRVPGRWNGTLVMDADLQRPASARTQWLMEQGYASASRSRNVTDWAVGAGSDDLAELHALFADKTGVTPRTTIVSGGSLGGLVSRDALNTYPEIFDGGIPMCGGGAGLVGMWNSRLDATFVLDALVGEEALELVRISDQGAADAALRALAAEALATPEGRARLALAGAIGGVSGWPAGEPEPARDDLDTRLETMSDSIGIMLLRRSVLEQTAGGNTSWNVGIDYRAMLDASGDRATVRALYRQASLDLDSDLEALAAAPRVSADAAAVDWARTNGVYDGVLEMPVLDMYTATDPRAALSEMRAYAEVVDAAGSGDMLKQAVVDRSGHCAFTAAEYAAAVDALVERIETGRWGGSATPAGLNRRAERLQADTSIDLGEAAFRHAGRVEDFPRTFSSSTPLPQG